MAGMAAEGREIPIADRELTRGRRGTHSDRAHHHRRWFRAPARCRPEAGVPSRPRAFAQLGVRGFDRLPAVDAGRRPALQAVPAFCSVGGTRFRPPPGGRCRSETGAPPSARFAQLGVRGFDRLPAVDAGRRPALQAVPRFCSVGGTRFRPPLGGRCRSETGAPPSARFAQLGVRGFDRLPAVDAGRRPALRRPRAALQAVSALLLSWGYAVSTASRRSMPVGDRRSAVRARFAQLGVRGFDRLPAVDAGRRPALRRPRACSRSTMRDLDARRAVRNPGLGVSLLRLRLCVTPRQGSAQRSYPGFPSHCRFQRAAVLQGSAVAGESQQSRRFSGTARHVLRARPRQRSGEGAPSPPQGSL